MEIKTVDDLRREYPTLVDQIEQAAAERAANEERQRIQDIEDMALPGSEEMTNKAKYGEPMSAADYAKEAMKLQKQQAGAYLDNVKEDAEKGGVNRVRQVEPEDGAHDPFVDAINRVGKKEA